MTTNEDAVLPEAEPVEPPEPEGQVEASGRKRRRVEDAPSWWHRGHPVFAPLAGFFTGTVVVLVVLGGLGVILNELFDYDLSEHPGPFLIALAALLVLTTVLVFFEGTRRFGRYMLFGLLVTPVVMGLTATITLVLLYKLDG